MDNNLWRIVCFDLTELTVMLRSPLSYNDRRSLEQDIYKMHISALEQGSYMGEVFDDSEEGVVYVKYSFRTDLTLKLFCRSFISK